MNYVFLKIKNNNLKLQFTIAAVIENNINKKYNLIIELDQTMILNSSQKLKFREKNMIIFVDPEKSN